MSGAWTGLVGVVAIALVHWHAARLLPGNGDERVTALSFTSGMSIAYVFVHVLPELGASEAEWLAGTPHRPLHWFDEQIYVAALIGLLVALGLRQWRATEDTRIQFWVGLGAAAAYNVLVGISAAGLRTWHSLVVGVVAFGGHMLLTDRGLRRRSPQAYDRVGRVVLAGAVLLGWLLGTAAALPPPVTAAAFGLLAGAIILHALAEELPEQRSGPYHAFVAGAAVYTALLLLLRYSAEVDLSIAGSAP